MIRFVSKMTINTYSKAKNPSTQNKFIALNTYLRIFKKTNQMLKYTFIENNLKSQVSW